jgi:hypothetical protein
MPIDDHRPPGPVVADQLQEEQTDRTRAINEHAVCWPRTNPRQTVQRAGQWFRARGDAVGKIATEVHILRGRGDILGKSSRAVQADGLGLPAYIHAALLAMRACTTGHKGLYGHVPAHLHVVDGPAHFYDTASHFVARDKRVGKLKIFDLSCVQVGSADAAPADLDQYVPIPDSWIGHLGEAYLGVGLKEHCFHRISHFSMLNTQ